jgi:hypothetical protein
MISKVMPEAGLSKTKLVLWCSLLNYLSGLSMTFISGQIINFIRLSDLLHIN